MDCATIEVREYLERSCGSWALAGADGPRNGIQNASRITNNLFRGLCMLVSALEMRLRAQITLLRVLTIGYTVAAAEPRARQELSDRRGKGLPLWIGEAHAMTGFPIHSVSVHGRLRMAFGHISRLQVNFTKTAMGARLLRSTLVQPLSDPTSLELRYDEVVAVRLGKPDNVAPV